MLSTKLLANTFEVFWWVNGIIPRSMDNLIRKKHDLTHSQRTAWSKIGTSEERFSWLHNLGYGGKLQTQNLISEILDRICPPVWAGTLRDTTRNLKLMLRSKSQWVMICTCQRKKREIIQILIVICFDKLSNKEKTKGANQSIIAIDEILVHKYLLFIGER